MTFAIATVPVAGGGRLGISRLPGARGALLADIAVVASWGARIVVSMTEAAEMAALGAAGLGEALADAGIDWAHLPIRDFGGPAGESAAAWPALSRRLHGVLDGKGGVLLHCRAGIGRSAMIGLRLLVERGEAPDAALARIRAVRPGAVETADQYAWAAAGTVTG